MARQSPSSNLERIRTRIVARVRELRTERRWTQAELAVKLGLSQARLSEIERGGGSLSAEQLVEVLRLFNVSLDDIIGPQPVETEIQNALARLGALHLREAPTALPSARIGSARTAIREALVAPRDARLILALAPVMVANLDGLNLDVLHDELRELGFPARVPWLVDNVRAALSLAEARPGRAAAWRRAKVVLGDFAARQPPPAGARVDHLDPGLRSAASLAQARAAASEISRRWGVISELQPEDFAQALEAAHVD